MFAVRVKELCDVSGGAHMSGGSGSHARYCGARWSVVSDLQQPRAAVHEGWSDDV